MAGWFHEGLLSVVLASLTTNIEYVEVLAMASMTTLAECRKEDGIGLSSLCCVASALQR